MAPVLHSPDRLAELLAGAALDDHDAEERQEFAAAGDLAAGREGLERAAGLAQLALLKADARAHAPLPDHLRERLNRQARAWQAGRQLRGPAPVADLEAERRRRLPTAVAGPVAARRNLPAVAGWCVAAALAMVFLVLRPGPDAGTPAVADAAARRASLMSAATDLVRADWNRSEQPGFEGAGGDVVWSDSRQEGYLRLRGLPANERGRAQYQLWIVDAGRDAHPVDGGVFDVAADGETVVPIHAALPVNAPSAFAVTLEKPGGVVVSDGPMLLVAATGG